MSANDASGPQNGSPRDPESDLGTAPKTPGGPKRVGVGEGGREIAIFLWREHRLLGTKPHTLVHRCTGPAPGPRPPALHFIYTTLLLLLKQSLLEHQPALLTHTPRPSSLGVGGFERAAPSAADPEKKDNRKEKT